MIDQEKFDRYWEKGWVVVEGVFERQEVEKIAEIALALSEEEPEAPGPSSRVDRLGDGRFVPRKVKCPFFKHSAFQELVTSERLSRAIEALVGEPPLLLMDQIFMKPPNFGSAKPYHQDNFYFRCFPANHVITAWIALDDVEAANGCLRYIDRSHKGPILPHERVPDESYNLAPPPHLVDLSKESLALVRKGGVVFHHSQTLHTSHRNESDRWRRGYATHWVTQDVTCENQTLDNAYFRSEQYPAEDREKSPSPA